MQKNPQPVSPFSRVLDRFDATMIVMGVVIGAGIFFTPSAVAQKLPSPAWILAAWLLGGLSAAAGALTFAELGSRLPRSGGLYVFLKEAYGRPVGFLYGWMLLLVSTSASVGIIAGIFASYLGYFLGFPAAWAKTAACLVILFCAGLNCLGVRMASFVQNVFTVLKIGAIAGIVALGLAFRPERAVSIPHPALEISPIFLLILGGAMVPVFFTYGGWHHINYIAGEVREPRRNVPFALITGIAGVMILYFLANLAYLRHLPVARIASSEHVAADAAEAFLGIIGGKIVAGAILVSTFGLLNALTLTDPRVYRSMAEDGLFFKWASRVHPRFGSPVAAILVQALWSCLLVLIGDPGRLMNYLVFTDCLFFAAAGAALFILRARRDEHQASFRVWLYPVTPVLFTLIQLAVAGAVLWSSPAESLAGILVALLGIGVYALRRGFARSRR